MWPVVLYLALATTLIWCWCKFWTNTARMLASIPGPRGLPLLGNNVQLKDTRNIHKTLTSWHREYGPVYKIKLIGRPIVVISGYDALHEALVKKGIQAGGRNTYFRSLYVSRGTGILGSLTPDDTWKNLRKASQRHLKQFGEGLSRLGAIIEDVAEDMFQEFEKMASEPLDPHDVVRDTAVKSLAFLLSGQRPRSGDPLLPLMKDFELGSIKYLAPFAHPKIMMYDWFPWLRHLRLASWQKVHGVALIRDELWEKVKQPMQHNPHCDSFVRALLEHCSDVTRENLPTTEKDLQGVSFREVDAKNTCVNLLLAGMATTTTTFYSLINILAHRQSIQRKLLDEIESVATWPTKITIKNRQDMPYTRAFIYEVLRYTSVVPLGVGHRAEEDVEIGGFTVPKGIQIRTNLWSLHNDPDFWTNPEDFQPERFLDETGGVVPADHPNRKHLMPFGAGTRVCLGEAFALARLFIWITAMIQRFSITPAEGNNAELTDARNYKFVTVLQPDPYEVVFTNRH